MAGNWGPSSGKDLAPSLQSGRRLKVLLSQMALCALGTGIAVPEHHSAFTPPGMTCAFMGPVHMYTGLETAEKHSPGLCVPDCGRLVG